MGAKTVFALLLGIVTVAWSGGPARSGIFRYDLLQAVPDSAAGSATVLVMDPDHQEPLTNALFSLVIPGAGQFRSEHYLKATAFLTAEAALIVYAILSNTYGDDKTAEFEAYAEAHWSAERYAKWINAYGTADYGPTATIDLARVRAHDFREINAWESASGPNKVGFSHMLPKYREQQYFELIGKYYQFKYGWDTYPQDANGVPQSDGRDYFNNFSADKQVKSYAANRGKANDYYYAASFAVSAMVINHAVSAIDAFFSTKNFNNALSANVQMVPMEGAEGGRLVSRIELQYGF